MKIRNGFVSNSSSSSFIVKSKRYDWTAKVYIDIISGDDIKKLLSFGFWWTDIDRASEMESLNHGQEYDYKKDKETESLGYRVTCNEEDVIYFLVKNDIPFSASCHYGHYSVFYDKNKKEIFYADNYGLSLEMYNWSGENMRDMDFNFYSRFSNSSPIIQSREEYLKGIDNED